MKFVRYSVFILIPTVVILVLSGSGLAAGMAPPGEEWNRTYGDRDNFYWPEYLQQTQDGGYVFLAVMNECVDCNRDVWLLKTDSHGKKQWIRTYGGPDDDSAEYMLQTNDGGYIIAGSSRKTDNFSYIWLLKTDPGGNEQWNISFGQIDAGALFFQQTFGRTYGFNWPEALQQTQDNDYIVMGSTRSNDPDQETVWLVKLDSTGTVLWNHTLGTIGIESHEEDFSFVATGDGGHIILKGTPTGESCFAMVKYDSKGIEQWNMSVNGIDGAEFFQQTKDGGYIIVRTHNNLIANGAIRLIKFDSKGNEQWDRSFKNYFYLFSVRQTYDGGYYLAGHDWNTGAWIIKTDSDGYEQWNRTFGGLVQNFIQQTMDGGYLLKGHERLSSDCFGDYVAVKIDSKGNEQWHYLFQGLEAGGIFGWVKTIEQTSDGGYILAGEIEIPGEYKYTHQVQLIKLKKEEFPSASFTSYPEYPGIDQIVTFDASSSYVPGENITRYQWIFGDGTLMNTTEKIITHSYTSEGLYNVNLTFLDSKFASYSLAKIVKVQNITADSDNRGKPDLRSANLEINHTQPAQTGPEPEISGFKFLYATGLLIGVYFIMRSMKKE